MTPVAGCIHLFIPISTEQESIIHRRERQLFLLAFVFLAASSTGLAVAPGARISDWGPVVGRWQHFLLLPAWALCAWLVHRSAGKRLARRDPYLLPAAYLLAGWGVLTIWRLLPTFGWRQTAWLVAASAILLVLVRSDRALEWLQRYRYLWLLAALFLTALTLFLGTHPSGGDPKLWLGCCGFYFQPSELLRLLLVAYFASYLSERMPLIGQTARGTSPRVLLPLVVVWGLATALLFVQRDLGTASLSLMLLAVLIYGASGSPLVLGIGALMVAAAALGAGLLLDVVRVRAVAWLAPWQDPTGAGYQVVQSVIAMASGGVFGQGIGLGSPGFIPAAHTDFIFSAIVEEWGLAGGLVLMGLVAVVFLRGLRAASVGSRPYEVLLAAGLSTGLLMQSALILGGVMRVIPLTGVTLPFVSYGGSSLITSFVAVGLLLRISDSSRPPHDDRRWLRDLGLVGIGALAALGLVLSWWTVVRAPQLRLRSDNPRRALSSRFSRRGSILDRSETILATTSGVAGEFSRQYPVAAASPIVGFDSALFGASGIEASMDPWLRGQEGPSTWDVWWKQTLTGSTPEGGDIRLNVVSALQERAMQLLSPAQGAVVLLEAGSGDVLALGTAPTFGSSDLEQDWEALIDDPQAPLINRAIQGQYQPGTSIAPLLYAWALSKHPEAAEFPMQDFGRPVELDGGVLSCLAAVEQPPLVILGDALRLACPAPWGELGDRLGASNLEAFQLDTGLGSSLEIELAQPASATGSLTPADARLYGMGQAGLTISPLQLARAYSAFVNEGQIVSPSIVDARRRPSGSWQAFGPPPKQEATIIDPHIASEVDSILRANDTFDYSALALSGEAEGRIAWYVGADLRHPAHWLVVVALENGSPAHARSIGLSLLQSARATLP